jgi:hypothetical protein
MSPHGSADLFASLVLETVAARHGGCLRILWPKDNGEVPSSAPLVAHAPVARWQQLCTRQDSGGNEGTGRQQRDAAQNRGVLSEAVTCGRRDAGLCRGAACSD